MTRVTPPNGVYLLPSDVQSTKIDSNLLSPASAEYTYQNQVSAKSRWVNNHIFSVAKSAQKK